MTAEYMAEKVLDLVADAVDDIDGLVEEDVRNGGYWFTLTHKGRHYEVEVTEVTQR